MPAFSTGDRPSGGALDWIGVTADHQTVGSWLDECFERRSEKAQRSVDKLRGWQYFEMNWAWIEQTHGPAQTVKLAEFMDYDTAKHALRPSALDWLAYESPYWTAMNGELKLVIRPDGRYGFLAEAVEAEARRRKEVGVWTKVRKALFRCFLWL